MAESQSQYVINDIPEELKPFRAAILNAASGLVFTPEYLRSQFPNAQFPVAPVQQQTVPPVVLQSLPQFANLPPIAPDYGYTFTTQRGADEGPTRLGRGAADLDAELSGRNRYAAGGPLRRGADELDSALNPYDVQLTGGGTPLGGINPAFSMPLPQLPSVIGTGTNGRIPLPPTIPIIPPMGGAGQIPGVTPGVPGVTQPPSQSPFPHPGGYPPPPASGGMVEPRFVNQRPSNFAGAGEARAAGYNPSQYADDSVAQDLARTMGGTVQYTNTIGPIAPPSQAMLNFGGSESYNAGLIAGIDERFANDPGMRQHTLNMLRDEIRSYGGTPQFKHGGTVRFNTGGWGHNADPNPTDITGTNTAPTQPAANPFQSPGTTGIQAINPYQPYRGQRVLSSGGNFGQQDSGGTFQVSDPTRAAYGSVMGLPSYFRNGEIDADRDQFGNATTPLGIANDIFDTSGRYAISAAANAEGLSGETPLRSSFGDTMSAIRQNPSLYSAGSVVTGQLNTPQLQAPAAVDVAGALIDPNNVMNAGWSNAFMQPVQGVGSSRFIDPNNPTDYMTPYMRAVTDSRRADAIRAFNEQKQVRDAQMVKAGAFGNNRRAIADALAERDLNTQLDRISAEGYQGAYENAQQQFERDQQRRAGADVANQRAALEVGGANLGAAIQGASTRTNAGLQALLANQRTGLEAALANQGAGLTAGRSNLDAALATQQLARTTNLSAAQGNQQARLAENNALLQAAMREDELQQQAAQGNFANRIAALLQQTNSATAASNIGQSRADLTRIAQGLEIQKIRELQGAGRDIDARTQAAIDLGYQDFINQRNYPYQQLGWMQSILSGVPMGYNTEQVMFNRTSPWAQAGGLATAGLGALSSYFGGRAQ